MTSDHGFKFQVLGDLANGCIVELMQRNWGDRAGRSWEDTAWRRALDGTRVRAG